MHDIVRESPVFDWIRMEGKEEGLEEGLEKGLEKGQENGAIALRQAIMKIVQERFPALVSFAEQCVGALHDLTILQNLVVAVSLAPDETKAQQALLSYQVQG